jgi:hypothetical protein
MRYSSLGLLLLTWNPGSTETGILASTEALRFPLTVEARPTVR